MIRLPLSAEHLEVLRVLLSQYEEVLHDEDDSALDRLFPVAYRDDADAAAEFSRYTRSGLIETKTSGAGLVAAATVGADGLLELTESDAERWLPVLTDLRLVLAHRLGIRADDDEVPDDEAGYLYHWLGAVQSELIDALDPHGTLDAEADA